MKDPLFTAEDFFNRHTHKIPYELCEGVADIANAKLESLLGPVLRANYRGSIYWTTDSLTNVHFEGRLFNVQEINPKECEHKALYVSTPRFIDGEWTIPVDTAKCSACGAKLKANWTAVDGSP